MEFRSECGRCRAILTDEGPAYLCANDCTWCATCYRELRYICPNCSGELVRRPRRGEFRPLGRPSPGSPNDRLVIRRASGNDVDAIAPLFDAYRQFYRQASDPTAARGFLRDRLSNEESVVLVAEEDGMAVGFTQLYPLFSSVSLGPIFVLNDLFVVPSHRRKRVGARLLEAARALGEAAGAHYLELSTAVDNPAQRLYESSGWVADREFLHYELLLRTDRPSG